ncbi:MAG: SDR family oxidoreductase [Clostridiales Family XIII bacterium]|jgi:NAD(P)-dependent dehydrogenase (short-subunit alcohol dehydrogenase family)|nr:SDR family oxidoreductase [Clostridiales Family XIII bacterium]
MRNIKFDFQGYNVVVTGGASGIGQSTALEFAKSGASVAVIDRDPADETLAAAESFGGKVKAYRADISDGEQVNAAAQAILKDFGNKADILFCNAGVGQAVDTRGSCEKAPDEEWMRGYSINTVGAIRTTRAFIPVLKERKFGKIVITASIAAYLPDPIKPVYCVTKLATIEYALCLAKEMGPYNVNVNVLNPGLVYTAIYSKGTAMALKDLYPDQFGDCVTGEDVVNKMGASYSVMQRAQKVEDCAYTVQFLCSEESKEITGQIFNVDSGVVVNV